MPNIIRRSKDLFLGIAIAIAVAACGSTTLAGGGEGDGSLTLAIAAPAAGADVAIPFDLRLESNVALGAPETGNRHVHVYFDTEIDAADAADYDVVYGPSVTVTRPLAPGRHTIIVALANADHTLAGPTQTITVNVTASGGGSGSSAPPAIDNPGFLY